MQLLSRGEKTFQAVNYLLLTVLALITIFPLWEVFRISISTPAEASRLGFTLWPKETSLDAYRKVILNDYIWIGYMNTIIRMVLGTAIQLLLTVLIAYPLSRRNLPNRGTITMIFVFTMFFSGGLIPEYLLIRQYLHLGNSIWALVLPHAVNTFSMLIVRNYMMGIPTELEESAKMDGAGDLRILWRIMLPLSVPILVTIGLWALVWHWNQWFDALIYLDNGKSYPLQMVLRKIVMDSSPMFTDISTETAQVNVTTETVKAATIIVSTLPIMLIYPFIQKYFIQGIMIGSVKG